MRNIITLCVVMLALATLALAKSVSGCQPDNGGTGYYSCSTSSGCSGGHATGWSSCSFDPEEHSCTISGYCNANDIVRATLDRKLDLRDNFARESQWDKLFNERHNPPKQ